MQEDVNMRRLHLKLTVASEITINLGRSLELVAFAQQNMFFANKSDKKSVIAWFTQFKAIKLWKFFNEKNKWNCDVIFRLVDP